MKTVANLTHELNQLRHANAKHKADKKVLKSQICKTKDIFFSGMIAGVALSAMVFAVAKISGAL